MKRNIFLFAVILTMGLTACGNESTTPSETTDSTAVSLDSTAVTATDSTTAHNQCKQRCALLMQNNSARIVVSNTFTQEWEMEEYIEMAKRYGYRVHTVIVENRHGGTNVHGVPDDKLQVMKERFSIQL